MPLGASGFKSPLRHSSVYMLPESGKDLSVMGIVVALLLLALLLGGVGLFVQGLKWVLIIALVMFIASFFSYSRTRR